MFGLVGGHGAAFPNKQHIADRQTGWHRMSASQARIPHGAQAITTTGDPRHDHGETTATAERKRGEQQLNVVFQTVEQDDLA